LRFQAAAEDGAGIVAAAEQDAVPGGDGASPLHGLPQPGAELGAIVLCAQVPRLFVKGEGPVPVLGVLRALKVQEGGAV